MWKELRKNDEIFAFAEKVWQKENSVPRWFRDANKIWNENFEEFEAFLADCAEIYGLFFEDELCALVYVEKQVFAELMSIHLSIINPIAPEKFVSEAKNLRTIFLKRGVKKISGWVLKKNFSLCSLLTLIGFRESGLVMKHGSSRGRVFRWSEFVLRGI